jgi:hypothetical protein
MLVSQPQFVPGWHCNMFKIVHFANDLEGMCPINNLYKIELFSTHHRWFLRPFGTQAHA